MNTMPNPAKIRAALALTGDDTLPTPLADALAVRERASAYRPGPVDVADLVHQLVEATPAQFDDTLDRLATEYGRRALMQAAHGNRVLASNLDRRTHDAYLEAAPAIAERLAPVFTKTTAALIKAAPNLPAGPAALDPAAVLAADARSPYVTAREAVATLHMLAGAVPVPLRRDGTTPAGMAVLGVVDVPELPVEEIHPFSESRLTPAPVLAQLHGVRRLVADYAANPELALLDVARNLYGDGVTFAWPTSPDSLAARVQRGVTAHLSRRVREHEPSTAAL